MPVFQRAVALALFALPAAAFAQSGDAQFAVGAGLGTTGYDLMASYKVLDNLNVRGTLSGLNYNRDGDYNTDTHYNGKFKLFQAGVLADYFPFDNRFRMSGGLVLNQTKLGLQASAGSSTTYRLSGNTYYSNQVGGLDGEAKWNKPALYLGLGFGNSVKIKGLSLSGDFGVLLTGKPDTTLTANCTSALSAAQCQQLQIDVGVEQNKLRDDTNKLNFWPVARLTLNYAF